MKKILFALIGVTIILCASSCDDPISRGRQMYKAYFQKTLKDPDSFKVYNEKYTKEDKEGNIKWELDYGAKNSLGGMVRESIVFSTFYGGQGIGRLFINGESYDYQELK